jgi:DNA-binding NtrC family response regulator
MLRFLQTGEIRRVGDTQVRHVQARVVAATNRDLEEAVAAGAFRSDLFYRFNAFTVRLPALRERAMDIPWLAYHFLTRAEAKLNKKVEGFSQQALACMAAYAWPGNVRELENVVERAVILCRAGTIQAGDLPLQIGGEADASGAPAAAPAGHGLGDDFQAQRERVIASFEKTELMQYIKQADGNISEAARLSGIPRRTFYRKMRKHGL